MSPQRAIEPSLQVPMDAYAFAAVSAPPSVSRPSFLGSDARGLLCSSAGAWRASDENAQGRRALGRVRFFAACARGAVCWLLSVCLSVAACAGRRPGVLRTAAAVGDSGDSDLVRGTAVAVRASPVSASERRGGCDVDMSYAHARGRASQRVMPSGRASAVHVSKYL